MTSVLMSSRSLTTSGAPQRYPRWYEGTKNSLERASLMTSFRVSSADRVSRVINWILLTSGGGVAVFGEDSLNRDLRDIADCPLGFVHDDHRYPRDLLDLLSLRCAQLH